MNPPKYFVIIQFLKPGWWGGGGEGGSQKEEEEREDFEEFSKRE